MLLNSLRFVQKAKISELLIFFLLVNGKNYFLIILLALFKCCTYLFRAHNIRLHRLLSKICIISNNKTGTKQHNIHKSNEYITREGRQSTENTGEAKQRRPL